MSEWTDDDRKMMAAETTLWIVCEALAVLEGAGAWSERVEKLRQDANKLAYELRDYNWQFEVIDE